MHKRGIEFFGSFSECRLRQRRKLKNYANENFADDLNNSRGARSSDAERHITIGRPSKGFS
jgi:hypothetical protein